MEIAHTFTEQKLDAWLISETMWTEQGAPPALIEALGNHKVYTHGVGWVRNRGVAIIVREGLMVAPVVLRDISASAMAVDVQSDGGYIRLIAVNLPSGLDNCKVLQGEDERKAAVQRATTKIKQAARSFAEVALPGTYDLSKNQDKRDEAERVRAIILKWRGSPNVTIAGGDMNETLDGTIDRIKDVKGTPTPGKLRPRATLHHMVYHDGWCDMMSSATDDVERFTRRKGGITAARLDYVLLYPPPAPPLKAHLSYRLLDEDITDPRGLNTDHRMILVTIPTPGDLKRAKKFLRPKVVRAKVFTADASEDQKQEYHRLVNAEIETIRSIRSRISEAHNPVEALDLAAKETSKLLVDKGYQVFGGSRGGHLKTSGSSPALRSSSLRRKWLAQLKRRIETHLRLWSGNSRRAALKAAARVWDEVGDGTVMTMWNAREWTACLSRTCAQIKEARKQVKLATGKLNAHPSNLKDRLFGSPRGRKKYYDRFMRNRNTGGAAVCKATDSDGVVHTDPDIYMDLVKEKVAKPFTVRYEGPAVTRSRDLSELECRTKVPDWWSHMYSRETKGIPASRWETLIRTVTRENVFFALKAADPGKSSKDPLSIDLLRIAVGTFRATPDNGPDTWVPSQILELLTDLVNAMLTAPELPASLTHGVITMIPKDSNHGGRVENMRPITLLHELTKLTSRILTNRLTEILDQPTL